MSNKKNSFDWRSAVLPFNSNIQSAIHSLEASCLQIVLVVDSSHKLLGTLTDGDIRRAFLRGLNLNSSIESVIHRSPLVVPPEISRELVLHLMQANKIHQLPVVNKEGVVVGLHVWDSVVAPNALENWMVIMAGGRGMRLHPRTEHCPKPMLEVGGKPMLQHIIERARIEGFRQFVISLHYLGEVIENYFGEGNQWGVHIQYIREKTPLGTAGCLSLLKHTPSQPIVVTNGDVLTDVHYKDMLDFHVLHQATATMAVRQYEMQNQFGVVKTKGLDIDGFEEKPIYRSHINAGIYVLNPEALSHLPVNQPCDMPTLFERVKNNDKRTIVYPMHEPWLDVGRPDDLVLAEKNF